jgi:hypothetical protein
MTTTIRPDATTAASSAITIAREFALDGEVVSARPYGSGHINDTYLVETTTTTTTGDDDDAQDGDDASSNAPSSSSDVVRRGGGGGTRRCYYVLQRINRDVFQRPDLVMENVVRVCDHARSRLLASGAPDADRRALRLVPTTTGGGDGDGDGRHPDGGVGGRPYWHVDDAGEYWRCYHRVPNATGRGVASSTDQARAAAMAFGSFQSLLADLPPGEHRLHETIPGFHDTPRRFGAFRSAASDDALGRAASASAEIEFALARERDSSALVDALRGGTIPERIAHNDAKMGNVLLDDYTDGGGCVVDLDTVMPGTVLYDFGDLVRTCTSPSPEDETDLSKVRMRFDVFEALVEGYLESTRDFLTETERSMMPLSGKLITFEIGLRFLTDYLEGDVYFRIDRPGHNLDRARAQFRLVESIEEQMPEMQALVDGYARVAQ